MRFEDLAADYGFPDDVQHVDRFVQMIEDEIHARQGDMLRVLDVGCGEGLAQDPELTQRIASQVAELWGLEPDPTASVPNHSFHRVLRSTLEEADLPEAQFDIVYAFMVVEHVSKPREFTAALCRLLKPGGVFLAVTPNGRHLFGLISKFASISGLEKPVLDLLRGREHVEGYHYPVRYRLNRPDQWVEAAETQTFRALEFAFAEKASSLSGYLPGPLRAARTLLNLKRTLYRKPQSLLHMFVRLIR